MSLSRILASFLSLCVVGGMGYFSYRIMVRPFLPNSHQENVQTNPVVVDQWADTCYTLINYFAKGRDDMRLFSTITRLKLATNAESEATKNAIKFRSSRYISAVSRMLSAYSNQISFHDSIRVKKLMSNTSYWGAAKKYNYLPQLSKLHDSLERTVLLDTSFNYIKSIRAKFRWEMSKYEQAYLAIFNEHLPE